jgi:hypothetical protein
MALPVREELIKESFAGEFVRVTLRLQIHEENVGVRHSKTKCE